MIPELKKTKIKLKNLSIKKTLCVLACIFQWREHYSISSGSIPVDKIIRTYESNGPLQELAKMSCDNGLLIISWPINLE